ncbi:MAG: hypothetical protein GX616_19450 [Planctomycetes bacterium]|nr:hypothetical protein [Planctomycetota bacterium]
MGATTDPDVYALTVYGGELIVGGLFTTAGGSSANCIARWNGASWQPLGIGMTGRVYALSLYNGELVAGGGFTTAGGQVSAYWARWGPVSVGPDLNCDQHVDGDDLDIFEACATGPGVPLNPAALPEPAPGCTLMPDGNGHVTADFDSDGDVDMADFAVFQRCWSGEGEFVNMACDD